MALSPVDASTFINSTSLSALADTFGSASALNRLTTADGPLATQLEIRGTEKLGPGQCVACMGKHAGSCEIGKARAKLVELASKLNIKKFISVRYMAEKPPKVGDSYAAYSALLSHGSMRGGHKNKRARFELRGGERE